MRRKNKAPRKMMTTIAMSPFTLGTKIGRIGRALLGVAVIGLDLAMFVIDTMNHETVTMPDAFLHIGLLLAGIALIDKEKVVDILTALKGVLIRD